MASSKDEMVQDLADAFAKALAGAGVGTARPIDPEVAARLKEHGDKRLAIFKATKKSKSHVFYGVTSRSYISGQGTVGAGTVVSRPLPKDYAKDAKPFLANPKLLAGILPSHTWLPVKADGTIDYGDNEQVETELEHEVDDGKELPSAVPKSQRASDTDVA